MTDITVRHEPASGAAVIEIRDAATSETRFRLRDPATEKYLAKRGWTKSAAFLPVEAVRNEDLLTITLDADLARKIPANAAMSLEQPAGGFRQEFRWPEAPAEVVAAVAPDVEAAAPAEPEPLSLDSFEPTIMDDRLHADDKRAENPASAAPYLADNDDEPSPSWKPAAIAAAVCLVLGMGIGYFWLGSGDDNVANEARQAAIAQIEQERTEFQRQLAAAKQQAAAASQDSAKTSEERIATLTGKVETLTDARDTAQKALADANAQIEAVKNAAGDEAKARISALEQKVASLTAELDKANSTLADRVQALRDAQAKLTEATDQIAVAKEQAQTQAAALKDNLTQETGRLGAEIDRQKQELAARDGELQKAKADLEAARAELASARDEAKSEADERLAALNGKIDDLTARLAKGEQQIAERDKALRDAQAKLSVANVQIDALKVVAGKSTETDLEKKSLSEKIAQLTAELDRTAQDLSDREQALAEANARLKDADAKLAAAGTGDQEPPLKAASDEIMNRLQEERDLFAKELKAMTGTFSTLKEEKAALEKTVASLKSQISESGPATSGVPARAIWGATAIDEAGTIYALQNQTGQKAAQDNVNAICRGKSRFRCEPLTTYSNACFSVARIEGEGPANDNFAYFVHRDWRVSASTALERCQSMGAACTIRFTACSPDTISKPLSD